MFASGRVHRNQRDAALRKKITRRRELRARKPAAISQFNCNRFGREQSEQVLQLGERVLPRRKRRRKLQQKRAEFSRIRKRTHRGDKAFRDFALELGRQRDLAIEIAARPAQIRRQHPRRATVTRQNLVQLYVENEIAGS